MEAVTQVLIKTRANMPSECSKSLQVNHNFFFDYLKVGLICSLFEVSLDVRSKAKYYYRKLCTLSLENPMLGHSAFNVVIMVE